METRLNEYGTAWELKLVEGDLVEMVSASGKEDRSIETSVGLVKKGPENEGNNTKVLYLFSDWPITSNRAGHEEEIWSGFRLFRRLVPAIRSIPFIGVAGKSLSEFFS